MSCIVKSSIAFCKVTFDSVGGSSVQPKNIMQGQPLGTLPSSTKSEYSLVGWFTESEGGQQVTPETIVTNNMILYAQWQDVSNPVVNLSSVSGQVTLSASDPQSGIAGYNLKTTNTTPALSDYTLWDGTSKSLAVSNDTNEYLWVKNGADLITKKSFFLHYHTGNSTSGGGCYGTQKTRQVQVDVTYSYADYAFPWVFMTNGTYVGTAVDKSNLCRYGANKTVYLVKWTLRIYENSAKTTYHDYANYHWGYLTLAEAQNAIATIPAGTSGGNNSGAGLVRGDYYPGSIGTTYLNRKLGTMTETQTQIYYELNCGKNEGITYI